MPRSTGGRGNEFFTVDDIREGAQYNQQISGNRNSGGGGYDPEGSDAYMYRPQNAVYSMSNIRGPKSTVGGQSPDIAPAQHMLRPGSAPGGAGNVVMGADAVA